MSIDTAFTEFPVLTSNRFQLRQIRPEDAEAFFAFKSDLDITSRYGQEPHQSLEDTHMWIQRQQGYYAQHDALNWCVTFKSDDTVIGACVLFNFDAGFHCAEIGYELHPAYHGQGIMNEVLSTILTYGFNELALHRIEANPLAGNPPSINLLRKLGFTYEGTLRQRHFFRGHFHDQLYFGLLREEWHSV